MARLNDLSGQRFERLWVVKRAPDHVTPSGSRSVVWLCKCDCGKETFVRANELRNGSVLSCGCYRKEKNLTHGLRHTRLYNIWVNMRQRCGNPNHPAYGDYGGRGIAVCAAWADDFSAFAKWALTKGYKDTLSIDRIDNDSGYSPDNCRWATPAEQAENRRPRKKVASA